MGNKFVIRNRSIYPYIFIHIPMRQTPVALGHCSAIHLLWQTLLPASVFSRYPDFCRKGKPGPAIGNDGVGREDTTVLS